MRVIRCLLVSCVMLATAGCDMFPRKQAPDQLSIDDGAAFVMLLDQLEQAAEIAGPEGASPNYCVSVIRTTPMLAADVSEELLDALRAHMPPGLNARLVPMSQCTKRAGHYRLVSGEGAMQLYAQRTTIVSKAREEWMAARICGGLCGYGNSYRLYYANGRPVVLRMGTILF